jgi:hypothetical protein
MAVDGWRLLRPGTGALVLGVDFSQSASRSAKGFRDLAALLPPRYAVWGTDEPAWRADRLPDPPAGAIAGVLGYCAGAALAGPLAARLHGDPPVVLFDPAVVTAGTLYDEFVQAINGLAAALPQSAREAALADGRRDVVGHDGPLTHLAARLAAAYSAVAGPACADQGVPPIIADQLCARVGTYLGYLARSATDGGYATAALVVLSAKHDAPSSLAGVPQLRLDTTQPGLLGDPHAAAAAAAVLAPASGHRAAHRHVAAPERGPGHDRTAT